MIFEWKAPAGFLNQSKYICAVCTFCAFLCFWLSLVNEWPPTGQIAVHSAYDMFSKYKYMYLIDYSSLLQHRFLDWVFLSDCAIS